MNLICIQSLLLCLCLSTVLAQQSKRNRVRKTSKAIYSAVYLRDIKKLPQVDQVEIIATALLPQEEWGKIDCQDPRNKCNGIGYLPMRELLTKTITGAEALRLAQLWRSLEPGGGAGCFAPGYQLRFKNREQVVLISNVCFHCCNVTLQDGSIHSICGHQSIGDFKKMIKELVPYPYHNEKKEK